MGSWWFHFFFEMIPLDGSLDSTNQPQTESRKVFGAVGNGISISAIGDIYYYILMNIILFFFRKCDQIGTPHFQVR